MHGTGTNTTRKDDVSALASRKHFPADVLWKTRPRCGGRHEFVAISRRRTKVTCHVRIPTDIPRFSLFLPLFRVFSFFFLVVFFATDSHEYDRNVRNPSDLLVFVEHTTHSLSNIDLSQGRDSDLQCEYRRLLFPNTVKRQHRVTRMDKYK